jgi:hypothetical protein
MKTTLHKLYRSAFLVILFLLNFSALFSQSIVLETLTETSVQCANAQVNITWIANNLENDFTQIELSTNNGQTWARQGEVAKSITNFMFTMPTVLADQYRIRVVNKITSDTTAKFSISQIPIIVTQMEILNERCAGGSITFAPQIAPPSNIYTYQWFKDGQEIPGQTNATLIKSNLQLSDAGIYTVKITGCQEINSDPAILSFNQLTEITGQPKDTSVCPGSDVTLSVEATGGSLTYQWKKNGNDISGEVRATYFIPSVEQSNTGTYTCIVTGICGSPITSNPAYVVINPNPVTGLNFTNDSTVCSGSTVRLVANGTYGNQFTYIWKKNGTLLLQSGPELLLEDITSSAAGTYSVQAKNECNLIAPEKSVKITVITKPGIARQTSDTTVYRGFATRLRVVTSGEALVYAWYKNDVLLPKDTTAILTISQTQFADSGIYHCVLTNSCGTVESDPIKVSVIQPPAGPKLTLSVNAIDFGCIDRNTVKDSTLTALIKNDGETQLTVSSITINGSQKTNFSIIEGAGSFNLDAGATRTVKLQFKPEDKKYNTAELVIASNSTVGAETLLPLSGTSCFEEVLTSSYEYGSIENGSTGKDTIIHVINSGTKAMRVDSVTVSGSSFTIVNPATLPLTVNASDTMSITVKFNNANAGTYTETLNVKTGVGMYAYTLTGTVKQPSDIIELGEERGFAVYPNPADNMLSLSSKFEARIRDMKIIDKLGNTVGVLNSSEITPGSTLKIQVNALPQGAYYLMVTERNEQTSAIPFLIVR